MNYGNVPEIDLVSPAEIAMRSRSYSAKAPSFEKRVTKLLESAFNMRAFVESKKLQEGQLFQLQNPSEKGCYVIDLGYDASKRKPNIIDDIFVALGDESGCYNYVATYIEAKNSGSYQRLAKRVLESRTYLLVNNSGNAFLAEQLLGNREWLKADKCLSAIDKIVKFYNSRAASKALRLKPVDEMKMFECTLMLERTSLKLKAARVQTYADSKGVRTHIVISMNSGKIWMLKDDEVTFVREVSGKAFIMTNFVMIKREDNNGNYLIVS